jgi:hypothetical protein
MCQQSPAVAFATLIGSNRDILNQETVRLGYHFNYSSEAIVKKQDIDNMIADSVIVISRHWYGLPSDDRHPLSVCSPH